MTSRSSTLPLRGAVLAALLAAAAGALALACSGTSGGNGAPGPCALLAACCAGMPAAEAASCDAVAKGSSDSSCSAALTTLAPSGACGGAGFDAGGLPATGFDAGLPCQVTGTCPGNPVEAGGLPAFDAGASMPVCEPVGTCDNGESIETCVGTSASGTCVAAVLLSNGAVFPCASCTNCAAATASAQAACGTLTPVDDAGGVDAGPDCGTPPVLHPETEAGVYCPFTATGSVHCAAGQECCETPSTTPNGSTCQAAGATCPVAGSLTWQCDGPLDCAGSAAGAVCCAAGTVAMDPTCSYERGSAFTGSHCAASCTAGEVALCDSTTETCVGTTCTPFKVAGVVLGTCM